MACVGIVGGLGVGATVDYYERIAAQCKARGVVPDLVLVHADVDKGQGFVREGRLDALADYLLGFIERLARAGATAAALPAVTPHICIDRIVARSPVPMIDIVATIGTELKARRRPEAERVPSGNIRIELPSVSTRSQWRSIARTLCLSPRRSGM